MKLTEKRKADRLKMAEMVKQTVEEAGAAAEIKQCEYKPSRVDVNIKAARGLSLNIDFDGKSCQPNVFVLSWHIDLDHKDTELSPTFAGSVNNYHFRKATDVVYDIDGLLEVLKNRLGKANDGTAFSC